MIVSEQSVRDVIKLNASATSNYSSDQITSNIQAATWFLEKLTQRRLLDVTATLKFTTNGKASLPIPGLRTASSVALNGAALTADSSYWLIPDEYQTGNYTRVQVRPFTAGSGSDWYKSIPNWFDLNLDSPKARAYYADGGLPNDLVIAGSWGYTDAGMPEHVRLATKAAAAFLTLRSDVMLSGARVTPEGSLFDLTAWPLEVQSFVGTWRTGSQASGL
jgi:hypothetical protein